MKTMMKYIHQQPMTKMRCWQDSTKLWRLPTCIITGEKKRDKNSLQNKNFAKISLRKKRHDKILNLLFTLNATFTFNYTTGSNIE